MEHVTFDEFFDFVKNEDANWYIPGLKEYFEGLNQDEIYIQDNFLGKLVYQFNKFENNLKEAVFDKFICYRKMTDEKEISMLKNSANEIANIDLKSAYSYNELFNNVFHNKLLEDINKYDNCGDVDSDLGIELRFNEIYDEETFNLGSLDIKGSTYPSIHHLYALSCLFGVSMNELIEESDERKEWGNRIYQIKERKLILENQEIL